MAEMIGEYRMVKDFTTKGAGMSRWGYAQKNGRTVFIKEFLEPKYPVEDVLPPEQLKLMRDECNVFFCSRKEYYNKLANCQTGNNVLLHTFFRFNTKYYVVTDLVRAEDMPPEKIAKLPANVKRSILKSVLNSVRALHENGVVHSDLKVDNILIKKTVGGYYAAKIIDFDSGFLISDPPRDPDSVVGDAVYFSPEAVRLMFEEDVTLTEKLDIYALGIIFHQYWCGELPQYTGDYLSVAQAALNGAAIRLNESIPPDIRNLIRSMLIVDPEKRPSAARAFGALCGERIDETDNSEITGWVVPPEVTERFVDVKYEETVIPEQPAREAVWGIPTMHTK